MFFYVWFHGAAGLGGLSCVAVSRAPSIQIPVVKEAVECEGYSKTDKNEKDGEGGAGDDGAK
jgi:hypothetical protein